MFDWLPLAVVLDGLVLVVHGGIGDGSFTIEDITRIQRPLPALPWDGVEAKDMMVRNLLYSDPADGDESMQRLFECFRIISFRYCMI